MSNCNPESTAMVKDWFLPSANANFVSNQKDISAYKLLTPSVQ